MDALTETQEIIYCSYIQGISPCLSIGQEGTETPGVYTYVRVCVSTFFTRWDKNVLPHFPCE